MTGLPGFVQPRAELRAKCDHPFGQQASTLGNRWLMRMVRTMGGRRPRTMIAYLEEYRTIYRGRGIPALYDAEIFALATTPCGSEEADQRGSEGRHEHRRALQRLAVSGP